VVTLAVSTYYWSVQAVDGTWAGSPFAAEESVDLTPLDAGDEGETPIQLGLRANPNPFTR